MNNAVKIGFRNLLICALYPSRTYSVMYLLFSVLLCIAVWINSMGWECLWTKGAI